jgi:rhodanese-related sulfurtransferase
MVTRFSWVWAVAALVAVAGGVQAAETVTARQLAEELEAGARLTLLDIRTEREFAEGHLPGALHVPLRSIARRELPPLGDVVAYGDGLGRNSGEEAAALLEAKPGIRARALAGGMAAWESAVLPTTHAAGVTVESLPVITYDQLAVIQRDAVVVDIRQPAAPREGAGEGFVRAAGAEAGLTDLRQAFPQARFIEPSLPEEGAAPAALSADQKRSARASAGARAARGIKPEHGLLVVVDHGDGSAEELARLLRASGNRRVVILAGGEEILRHEGRPGLGRWGTTFYRDGPALPEPALPPDAAPSAPTH